MEKKLTKKQELCLQCMLCCKSLLFQVSAARETVEFYKARGLKLYHPTCLSGNFIYVEVPHICQHLTEKGCAIYSKRPSSCAKFDGRTNIITQNTCLWPKFSEVKEGE